ncbi:MAG: hypothetical protein IJI92_06550 [Erysipelotrichaceae bacterium]|nr:hypothetical protein [Erysipelotrichaceae bacterium]
MLFLFIIIMWILLRPRYYYPMYHRPFFWVNPFMFTRRPMYGPGPMHHGPMMRRPPFGGPGGPRF